MVKRAFWLLSPFSICREPISVDIAASHRIFLLSASIPEVSFHGMDNAIFAVFHNTHMVNRPICASNKKDDISGHRLIVSILPLSLCFEPVHAVGAERKLRNNPRFDVAALLRAPAHKAGTPLHAVAKAVPGPVGLSALLPDLRQCQLHNGLISNTHTEGTAIGVITQHMSHILFVSVTAPAHLLSHLIGKFRGVGHGIAAIVSQRPGDVAAPVVIALQGQLDPFHVHRVFHPGSLQRRFQLLHAALHGILRIGDAVWHMRIAGFALVRVRRGRFSL